MRWSRVARVVVVAVTMVAAAGVGESARPVAIGAPAPEIAGERWIGGAPVTIRGLRGRVVLVEFWTYG
jgi:hypothetical protein